MKYLCLSILAVLGLSYESQAQIEGNIDTIFVQAARIPMKASSTGRNVSIVTPEMIGNTYATSLDDLLQYIPGIEVQSRNAFGAQGDITMRGSTFTQVLVLVDGMRLNDPLTAHFNSNIPVSPSEIERIEVLRGASASIYGADAVGGVINIITKGFSSKTEDTVNAEINLGQNKLLTAQQGFALQKENTYLGGGFNFIQSDGELIPAMTVNGNNLEEYNNFFDIKTVGLSLGHKWKNGWKAKFRTAYDHRDFSARYFYTTSPFDKSTEVTRNWWNQLQIIKSNGSSSTDFNVSYKYNTDEFVFSPDFPSTNNHITKFFNFVGGHLIPLGTDATLRVGVQLDHRSIESNDRGNHSDWHFGAYAMSHVLLTDKLSATGSMRVDYDENYNWEVTPQLNATYDLGDVIIRGSVGRSIRAADYTERYVSFNLENLTPGRSLGNPDLIAESNWSQEIGADFDITRHWKLKSTAFFRQSDNLIDYISTNERDIPFNQRLQSGENYFFATNISAVTTKGIELESWLYYPITKSQRLEWTSGYTKVSTSNEEGTISVYISSHASDLFTNRLNYTSPDFDISLTHLYKKRNERFDEAIGANLANSYSLWSGRFRLHFTEAVSGQIQVHNLFDVAYADILGAPMPGRWLSGGLSISL